MRWSGAQAGPDAQRLALCELRRRATVHVAEHINADIVDSVLRRQATSPEKVPLWCPWPLPTGWMVTAVGWAGDDRQGVRATALSCSGPEPTAGGPPTSC